MTSKLLIGILIGGAIGALMGHFGKCSSGGCPLTATPLRGAIYGAIMGAAFLFAFGSTTRTTDHYKEEQPAPGEGLVYIGTPDAFEKTIVHATLPCLVDFYSDSCPPCRRLGPTIHELAEEYVGRAVVCKINVASAQALATTYHVESIPTVLFFKDGNVVERLIGLKSKVAYEEVLEHLIRVDEQ
jgi:thioredoxin 1